MNAKTRKRVRVSRTQINVTWKKGQEESKRRFHETVEKTGVNVNALIITLIDEWVKVVNEREKTDILKAATATADRIGELPKK